MNAHLARYHEDAARQAQARHLLAGSLPAKYTPIDRPRWDTEELLDRLADCDGCQADQDAEGRLLIHWDGAKAIATEIARRRAVGVRTAQERRALAALERTLDQKLAHIPGID